MKKERYRLGLVSVSFRQRSPKEILDAAKAAGLSCIEWGSDVHAPCNDIEKITEIADLQKKYGIECSSYGAYFRLGETPIEELEQYIGAAKGLGADIIRLWCGRKSGSDMTDEERGNLLSVCRQAAEIAEARGVTLCMECHKNTFTEKPADAVRLMKAVNSPYFRMYWQPFQWQSITDNLAYAETIAPFTRHIHVFQWKDNERFSLNDGIDEWRGYLNKFSAPRTLLLEFMPNGTVEELAREVEALRTIIGENV